MKRNPKSIDCKNNKYKKIIVIISIIICMFAYVSRVFYINKDAKSVRAYHELKINKWESCYGGKMKVTKVILAKTKKHNVLKIYMDFENIDYGKLMGSLLYDDYLIKQNIVNIPYNETKGNEFSGLVLDLGSKKIKKNDVIIFDNGYPYEKYILKLGKVNINSKKDENIKC